MRKHVFTLTLLCVAVIAFLSGSSIRQAPTSTIVYVTKTVESTVSYVSSMTVTSTRLTTIYRATTFWSPMMTFTGTASQVTNPFTVAAFPWRIIWKFQTPGPNSLFTFDVYVIEESGRRIIGSLPGYSDHKGDSGIMYIHQSGEFCINVNAVNAMYSLVVEVPSH